MRLGPRALPVTTLLPEGQHLPSASHRLAHLGLALEIESEDIFAPSRLTLTNQEDTVGAGASFQH